MWTRLKIQQEGDAWMAELDKDQVFGEQRMKVILAFCELAKGVAVYWPDARAPAGVAVHYIKGKELFRRKVTGPLRAIMCCVPIADRPAAHRFEGRLRALEGAAASGFTEEA